MKRKEFLSVMGVGAAGILALSCLSSCKKEEAPDVDFTLDLNSSSNAALATNGGYLISQGVIVAKTNSGDFIAVSAACTHQGVEVEFQSSNNRFYCSGHGANFSTTGAVLNGPANSPLKKYNTSLNGNVLRIYS